MRFWLFFQDLWEFQSPYLGVNISAMNENICFLHVKSHQLTKKIQFNIKKGKSEVKSYLFHIKKC